MKNLLLFIVTISCFVANAQIITKEDSLNAGLTPGTNATVISGYGQAKVAYDLRFGTGEANITRNVMFFGHKFNDQFGFFSETELENAKVANGASGEISLEQLFLKTNLNRNMYLVTGLFIPRIGTINENHLPTTFNGNDRPFVEQLIIPSTWREIGIGLYGQTHSIPGLNYSVAVINGLNAQGFSFGSGIREGRFEGSQATAGNIAVTGALLYYFHNFRFQVSGYYGGANGLSKRESDSLQLDHGAFGTPISLLESNIQYHNKGISVKALTTVVDIYDADKINRAYASNTPSQMVGSYVEAAYNVLYYFNPKTEKNLSVFSRYEYMNLNNKLPENGVKDNFQEKQYWVSGITYQPVRGIVFKADYIYSETGNYNTQLYVVNPYATQLPFYKSNHQINVGFGYSF
ncbi:MAG: hypothetical protein V4643_11635 [Bacteroidota bacterium]